MTAVASLTHVQVVVKHTLPTQLQRSLKLKISHWFYWSVFLAYKVFIFCQKSTLRNHFAALFYSHPFRRYSSSVVNPVVVTALLLTSFLHCS